MNALLTAFGISCVAFTACSDPMEINGGPADTIVAPVLSTYSGTPLRAPSSLAPSSNEANEANGWAYVTPVTDPLASSFSIALAFVNPRELQSCFEIRVDDEPSIYPFHYNNAFSEMWAYRCARNGSFQYTFEGADHVDIRLVFGDYPEEWFDWTRFSLQEGEGDPMTIDDCKKGGWEAYGFRNQGQCVRFVETGKDSRGG